LHAGSSCWVNLESDEAKLANKLCFLVDLDSRKLILRREKSKGITHFNLLGVTLIQQHKMGFIYTLVKLSHEMDY